MIDKIPSADLWDGQTDEEKLGYTYVDIEKTIKKVTENPKSKLNYSEREIKKMNERSNHKLNLSVSFSDTRNFCEF